jgi:ankyrin repeat protein
VGDNGDSALHLAAGNGNVRAIKLLVDAGADVNTLLDNAGKSTEHVSS